MTLPLVTYLGPGLPGPGHCAYNILPRTSQDEGRIQALFHARLCGVIVLAHVCVRARMHVCVMCLSARCASGYVCSDVHVRVFVHVHAHVHVHVHVRVHSR